MAQQCAVAGQIAGMVQERPNAAGSVAVGDHEDHHTADRPAAAEQPVPNEETASPPLMPVQTRNIAQSQRVEVPVDLFNTASRLS